MKISIKQLKHLVREVSHDSMDAVSSSDMALDFMSTLLMKSVVNAAANGLLDSVYAFPARIEDIDSFASNVANELASSDELKDFVKKVYARAIAISTT